MTIHGDECVATSLSLALDCHLSFGIPMLLTIDELGWLQATLLVASKDMAISWKALCCRAMPSVGALWENPDSTRTLNPNAEMSKSIAVSPGYCETGLLHLTEKETLASLFLKANATMTLEFPVSP